MGSYYDDPAWADITPLPTDDGGPHSLAAIAYSDEYEETMSYLRAVMAANEHSDRVLGLTEDLIDMNPAHYTVWLYRAATLFALQKDLKQELEWLNEVAVKYLKNYQIWHHRNLIVDKLAEAGEADVPAETHFVERMFDLDAKNYHVWSYRQWLVRRFDLFDDPAELAFVQDMLRNDVRNNSAWNHRWFIVNGRPDGDGGAGGVASRPIRDREMDFAKEAIAKAPQNQSAWNYLRGVVVKSGAPSSGLLSFAAQYADLSRPDAVRSSHALDLLADILADDGDAGGKEQAARALDLLASKYDPIRKNYWEYRKSTLGLAPVAAS